MKKIAAFILATIAALTLTGCGHVDPTTTINPNDHSVYHYNKIHVISSKEEENKCYDISEWYIDEKTGKVIVNIIGMGEYSFYSWSVVLVEDKCPICDKEE